ncbi:MAG: cyclodeaminase/cyclohydrolase family protein, partial [Firmicutes bacterium]|nr:cyclodeaminase/cyclohydrolase family protein [Bacillota bacterium]
ACYDIVAKGNKNAASDALAGALMMRAAVLGSVYNVRINLQSINDEAYCEKMLEEAAALEKIAFETEEKIMAAATELTLK